MTNTEPRWNNLTPNMERVLDALTRQEDLRLTQFPSGRWAVTNSRGSLVDTCSLTPAEFSAFRYEGFINADGSLA